MADTTDQMHGEHAQQLLTLIAESWRNVTTIVQHGGSVFEYLGPFPPGEIGSGFYNFGDGQGGFHGHLNLALIDHITFQDKPHAGRDSYAFVFRNEKREVIFKIFLGRDEAGTIIPEQLTRFKAIRQRKAP